MTLAMPKVGLRAEADVVAELHPADISMPRAVYERLGQASPLVFVPSPIIHLSRETSLAANERRFHGSPSVTVKGVDPFSDPENPVGLICRTYINDRGVAGSPTRDQLSRAIINAHYALSTFD